MQLYNKIALDVYFEHLVK